jgi:hypothetical protein
MGEFGFAWWPSSSFKQLNPFPDSRLPSQYPKLAGQWRLSLEHPAESEEVENMMEMIEYVQCAGICNIRSRVANHCKSTRCPGEKRTDNVLATCHQAVWVSHEISIIQTSCQLLAALLNRFGACHLFWPWQVG